MCLGLLAGFKERTTIRRFGGLTLRVASRFDLIHLKRWSARGSRRAVDVEDLRQLRPNREEIRIALAWCAALDGRSDFITVNAAPVLVQLGFSIGNLTDECD